MDKKIKKKMKKKNIYQSLWYGVKLGYKDDATPNYIIELELNLWFKIFKWLGMISVLLVLSGVARKCYLFIYYLIFLKSIIYIYICILEV
jgi:hypothetical protein